MSTAACTVLLAHKWSEDSGVNPSGYWMSEKLDGVRAYWSGSRFYSRNGNAFPAPKWFTADLPKTPLDGELWAGRGQFSTAISIAKSRSADPKRWARMTFAVFDAPTLAEDSGRPAKYEKRLAWLEEQLSDKKFAAIVPTTKCKSKDHMQTALKQVEMSGGEGLMLREPKSVYENGRSHTLLKVKSFSDEEGIVVGHEKGKGNNMFVTGALVLKTPDGRSVKVGSGLTDAERRKPPKKGSIVTYKYFEISKSGAPRFPTFVGVRTDMKWKDYCASYTPPAVPKPGALKRKNSILFGPKMGFDGEDEEVQQLVDCEGCDSEAELKRDREGEEEDIELADTHSVCGRSRRKRARVQYVFD